MTEWLPESETWWTVPVGAGLLVIILEAILRPMVTKVSLDVMEWCNLESLKDTARSVWTNLAVTAALLLTVAVAMLQGGAMEPRFEVTEDMKDMLNNIQSAYDLFCGFSVLYCMVAVLQCVIYLCYVDPLSNKDGIKFFIANPATIGGPVLSTIFGCLYCGIGMLMWVLGTSGLMHAVVFSVFLLVLIIFLCFEIADKSTFDPSGQTKKAHEWQWTHRPEHEWPWFAKKAKNEKATRVFKKMGEAVQDEVQKPGTIQDEVQKA